MTVDNSGNIYVTGFVTKLSGKCLITIKYDTNGNVIWKETLGQGAQSVGDDISVHNNGDLIISGQQLNSSSSDAMALSFDSDGNLKWLTVQPTQNEASEPNTRLTMDSKGRAYVSSITQETASPSYAVQQYETFSLSEEIEEDSLGNPLYFSRQLVVRFNGDALDTVAINNLDLLFGPPESFLLPQQAQDFYSKIPVDPGVYTFKKVYDWLKSTDTISISRLGEEVPIPAFWATFVINIPTGVDILNLRDSVETLPFVHFAHPNYVVEPTANTNDPAFSMQKAFFSSDIAFVNGHINIKNAWDFSTGIEDVRIGIFDTGLDWRHPDFGYDGIDPNTSKVVDGWDININQPLKTSANPEPARANFDSHGTKCAGIIGAIRNENFGVAGVAGGDGNPPNGVSLYGFKIWDNDTPFPNPVSITDLANTIRRAVEDQDPNIPGTFGLHIMNHSWSSSRGTGRELDDQELGVLREAVRDANRNHVVFVASRGNSGFDEELYPAVYDDDWIISVGGSNKDGEWASFASFGSNLDIVAPATSDMHWTTKRDAGYDVFSGTSSAAPLASGVAGLLLSYLNDFSSVNGFRCAPEDVEFILQKSAYDISASPASQGPDDITGYGLLDAGAAPAFVDKADRTLVHLSSEDPSSIITSTVEAMNVQIILTENYAPTRLGSVMEGTYNANVYKIEATVNNSLPAGKNILHSWPRSSSSNVFPLYNQTTGELIPHHKVEIVQVNQTTTKLVGYVYEIQISPGVFSTIPSSTSIANKKLAYSLLLTDSPVGIETLNDGSEFKIYPIPVEDHQTLEFNFNNPKDLHIALFDIQGKKLETIYRGQNVSGSLVLGNDVKPLSSGVYIYLIEINGVRFYSKFVKN